VVVVAVVLVVSDESSSDEMLLRGVSSTTTKQKFVNAGEEDEDIVEQRGLESILIILACGGTFLVWNGFYAKPMNHRFFVFLLRPLHLFLLSGRTARQTGMVVFRWVLLVPGE
jgi:hypothetical protein